MTFIKLPLNMIFVKRVIEDFYFFYFKCHYAFCSKVLRFRNLFDPTYYSSNYLLSVSAISLFGIVSILFDIKYHKPVLYIIGISIFMIGNVRVYFIKGKERMMMIDKASKEAVPVVRYLVFYLFLVLKTIFLFGLMLYMLTKNGGIGIK